MVDQVCKQNYIMGRCNSLA